MYRLRPAFCKPRVVSEQLRYSSGLAPQSSPDSGLRPLTSVLIANRGEIALRVGRTAADEGIKTTTIYTIPDAQSQHALSSPYSVSLHEPNGYLDGDRIIRIAKERGCQGIHPGYGFLSENPGFARKCIEQGLIFIGPPWKAIEAMGSKSRSKEIMNAAGVPCIPGYHGVHQDPEHLKSEADMIGYPVLLKAVKGGGGKGMRIVHDAAEFHEQLASAKSEAMNAFGDQDMLVEQYITRPRHIEVQIFADKHGNCVALGERDCSIQRRHQKIVEESPAPHLDDKIRKQLWDRARAAARAVGYEGAGTVEFIFDNQTNQFFFMEMNTRLQVEHPVTEMVTGQDLVEWQFIVARGGRLPLTQDEIEQEIGRRGHAIEARIYAENPDMNFIPDSGTLVHVRLPTTSETVRVDAGFVQGDEVSSHYDPMLAKLIVRGPSRQSALLKLRTALDEYEIGGLMTNIEFLKKCCVSPDFVAGQVETGYIEQHSDELFAQPVIPDEAIAQVGVGLLQQERDRMRTSHLATLPFAASASTYQTRAYTIEALSGNPETKALPITVSVTETSANTLAIILPNGTEYDVAIQTSSSKQYTTFFKHTRIKSTLIQTLDIVTIWQCGQQYRFKLVPPPFLNKALGKKDLAPSVLAPMPCKVLKVQVKVGQQVSKGQIVAIIESMKMETAIRCPKDGVIRRIVHGAGDMCKAGMALVEFEDDM